MGRRLSVLDEEEASFTIEDVKDLHQQVALLSLRNEELENERNNAFHNTEIWKRQVEEQSKIIGERDTAIEKLLSDNLKMKKEFDKEGDSYRNLRQKYEELKRQYEEERKRTDRWHASMTEAKSNKLDDLQREMNQLKARNDQLTLAESSQGENMKLVIRGLNEKLRATEIEYAQAGKTIERLEKQYHDDSCTVESQKIKHLIAENEAQTMELRGLKRQLWDARESPATIRDLRRALELSNDQIWTLRREKEEIVESVRSELKAAEDMHRQLDQVLQRMEAGEQSRMDRSLDIRQEERVGELEAEITLLNSQLESASFSTILKNEDTGIVTTECSGDLSNKLLESQGSLLQYSVDKIKSLQIALAGMGNELQAVRDESGAEKKRLDLQLTNYEQTVEGQKDKIRALESQLNEAKEAREASEAAIIKMYEGQMAEKDGTILQLRQDLAAFRNRRAEEISKLTGELKDYHARFTAIHDDYGQQLQGKEQHIYALEHTLHSQEQTLDNMRGEMDQLQKNMQLNVTKRRAEVDELQEELIVLRTEMSRKDKELISQQMLLTETELKHRNEVLNLKESITELESEAPFLKTKSNEENDQRIIVVKQRLDHLKSRNSDLNEENRRLGQRLEKSIIKIQKLENQAIEGRDAQTECDILRKQVAELQETLEKTYVSGISLSQVLSSKPSRSTNADRSSRPLRQRTKAINTPIRRLFGRNQPSSATRSVMIDDENEPGPLPRPRARSSGQDERRMYV